MRLELQYLIDGMKASIYQNNRTDGCLELLRRGQLPDKKHMFRYMNPKWSMWQAYYDELAKEAQEEHKTMTTAPEANQRVTTDVNTPMHIAFNVLKIGTGQTPKSEELDDCFYWLMSQAQSLGIDTASWLNALATAHGHDIVTLLAENMQPNPDEAFFYELLYRQGVDFDLDSPFIDLGTTKRWAGKPCKGTGLSPLDAWNEARKNIDKLVKQHEHLSQPAEQGTKMDIASLLREWNIQGKAMATAVSLFLGRRIDRENGFNQAEAYSLAYWLRTNDSAGVAIATIWNHEIKF